MALGSGFAGMTKLEAVGLPNRRRVTPLRG